MVVEDAVFHAVAASAVGGELIVQMLRVKGDFAIDGIVQGEVFIRNGGQLVGVKCS